MTRGRIALAVALVLIVAILVVWELLFSLEADSDAVEVAAREGRACPDPCAYSFGDENADAGLILYQGAGVEPVAYAPLAAEIADAGFFVTIQQAPLDLPVFHWDMAQPTIDAFGGVDVWSIGGHSLGGAMAARFSSEADAVDGLVFLAAYPEAGLDLRDSDLAVLSIYGDRDRLSTPDEVLSSRSQLPDATEFVLIEGGNHAQFGSYGRQPRDGEASISAVEQRHSVSEAVIDFLGALAVP